jgi:hypothetical protein
LNYAREQLWVIFLFEKTRHNESKIKRVYFRITIDGIPREASTRPQWNMERWDRKSERASGTKEDARSLNLYLDSLANKIHEIRTELLNSRKPITSKKIMDQLLGKNTPRIKLLEEFQKHNHELETLVGNGYTGTTLERFDITQNTLPLL